jgi:hypothetical protein
MEINEISSMFSFRVFFVALTYTVLISTIILILVGKGHIISDFSLLLQTVFLHVYINSQFLPSVYKVPISGMQNF